MKIAKKLISILLAFTLVIGFFLVPTQTVNAQSFGAIPTKFRMHTSTIYEDFSFDLPGFGYSIANLKVNSSKIKVKQTVNCSEHWFNEDIEVNTNYATIELYTQKEGNYKVNFDIIDPNGAKVSSHVVKVYAYDDSAFKSFKLGKNSLSFSGNSKSKKTSDNFLLKGKSGKIQVKMAKGYKLKKIEYGVHVHNKDKITVVYTPVKNKGKVTYGTVINERSYSYNYVRNYETFTYINQLSSWDKPPIACTYVDVTYIDKYTKCEDTRTFVFYQWVK